jgi:hypothetical protein
VWPVVLSTVPAAESPDRFSPFSGPLLGGCSCRVSAFSGAGRISFQQPDHHWHTPYSNLSAVIKHYYFQSLANFRIFAPSAFW